MNQTRFQFLRDDTTQTPASMKPAVNVLGAFTDGGNITQTSLGTENHYELQNLTTMTFGKHQLVFGGRLRDYDVLVNSTTQGYNGAFTFGTINEYIAAEKAFAACPAQCPAGVPETQFSLTAGNPEASINYFDAGLYGEDSWRPRQNISLSLGLRFESQNYINDHADFAPRLGFAWGIGGQGKKAPKAVLRAGFGIFYDRFRTTDPLCRTFERHQSAAVPRELAKFLPEYSSPEHPRKLVQLASRSRPDRPQSARAVHPAIRDRARAPIYEGAHHVRYVHQFARSASASRKQHQCTTRFQFLPILGSRRYNNLRPLSGVFPYGQAAGYLDRFESVGLFNENQLVTNFSLRGKRATAFGFYTLSYANSDTAAPLISR